MKALTISKLHNGVESQVGTITFDNSNNGTLVTEGDQDEAQRLRKIWEEASRRESLPMQKAERKEVNGEKVTKYTSTNVPKSDDRYPAAVWSYLERQHGYLVDKKE